MPSGRPLRISGLLRLSVSGFVVRSFPKSPWFLLAQRRRFRLSRVTPKLPSSADPYLLSQVAPASASTAGSMITPWLNRTLHPRLAPRMNLRYQSGTSIPDLISSALLIPIHVRNRPITNLKPKRCLRRSPGRSCCSNQLQSHQLVRDSRPDGSVDASAKPQ